MNKIKYFFSSDYLWTVSSGGKFEAFYLFFSITIILAVIAFKLYLFFKKNRPKTFKNFDSLVFWGFFTEGLLGLFIWFSRSQALRFFSTRLVSYIWILSFAVFVVYAVYYFKFRLPRELEKHYEKKRKEKYLK